MSEITDLTEWIRENSYALAMAAVGAYDMAPDGSGIDLSLGAAGDAIVAMIEGERDPLEAVRKAIGDKCATLTSIGCQGGSAARER